MEALIYGFLDLFIIFERQFNVSPFLIQLQYALFVYSLDWDFLFCRRIKFLVVTFYLFVCQFKKCLEIIYLWKYFNCLIVFKVTFLHFLYTCNFVLCYFFPYVGPFNFSIPSRKILLPLKNLYILFFAFLIFIIYFSHLLIYSFIHSFIYLFINLFIHSFIYIFIYLFIFIYVHDYSSTEQLIYYQLLQGII